MLWEASVLLLSNLSAQKGSERAEFPFIQTMERTEPLHEVDRVLRCTCIRWSTNEGVDQIFETQVDSNTAKALRGDNCL